VAIGFAIVGALALTDYVLAKRVDGFDSRNFSADPEFRLVVGLIMLSDVLATVVARSAESFDWPGNRWAWLALGLVLICAGGALRHWAILTLGRFFRFVIVIQNDHRVVTNGPYRLVRHPAYTGALLVQIGIGIALANSLSLLICLLIPMAALVLRIRREESALAADLGTEYLDYAATTKRLIPKIW
jgi:protein-S-isoprenylcysteine O-methyltransferase